MRHVTRSSEMNIATNINNHLRSIDPSVSQSVSLSASWNMRDHRLQCYMWMGWDEMGWDRMGLDGMGWDGMGLVRANSPPKTPNCWI